MHSGFKLCVEDLPAQRARIKQIKRGIKKKKEKKKAEIRVLKFPKFSRRPQRDKRGSPVTDKVAAATHNAPLLHNQICTS